MLLVYTIGSTLFFHDGQFLPDNLAEFNYFSSHILQFLCAILLFCFGDSCLDALLILHNPSDKHVVLVDHLLDLIYLLSRLFRLHFDVTIDMGVSKYLNLKWTTE